MPIADSHRKKEDTANVRVVNVSAFETTSEADLVASLHEQAQPIISLVADGRGEIGCEYEVPEEVFMVNELRRGYLRGAAGIIKYHAAFGNV